MTEASARELRRGDRVMFGGDPRDDGEVVATNGDQVIIQWRGDATTSTHFVDAMSKVERRPLRAPRR